MSDVNINVVVQPFVAEFIVETSTISFTPEVNLLSIYTGGFTAAAGASQQVQFNKNGALYADPTFTFDTSNTILHANNISANTIIVGTRTNLGAPDHIIVSGGSTGQYLTSDSTHKLQWETPPAFPPGGTAGQLQYLNGPNANFDGTSGIYFNPGVLTFITGTTLSLEGDASHFKLGGGTNGYVLQTDGVGNLSWTAQTGGGGGGGVPAGSNSQIQFNLSGAFGASAGLTYDATANTLTVPYISADGYQLANLNAANLSGAVAFANVANSVAGANVSGAVSFATTANSIAGANVSGMVATANTANRVTGAYQPYITSTGTLTGLTVAGTTTIQQAQELVKYDFFGGIGAAGTVNFDILNGATVLQSAVATADFIINLRGNSTTSFNTVIGSGPVSMTCSFINKNAGTNYVMTQFQIDGTAITVVWPYGIAPTSGTANGYDIYTFNVVKPAFGVTYVAFGSVIGYS